MQNHFKDTRQSLSCENLRISSSSSSIIPEEIDDLTEGFRRKKSASLNSPANSGKRNLMKEFIYFFLVN
jgi:hypothetical protein